MKKLRSKFISALRWFFGFKPTKLSEELKKKRGGVSNLTVTVIVPAWNEEGSIINTIESILNQSRHIDEIIVVDDSSSDRTNEIASAYACKHPQIKVVRTHENQGTKAMSQNYVLPMVTTDLFVTIDGDTALDKYAIECTMGYFHNPNMAIVCGFVVPQKVDTFWERGRFFEYVYSLTIMKSAQNHWGAIVVASGCFSVFRTRIIQDKFGGFEQRTMAEDMDLTWNAVSAGYDVRYAQNALCYPVDPPTFKVLIRQLERWYCAFFQNIMVRGNLFRHSKKLAVVIYGYCIWSLIGIFLLPYIGWTFSQNIWGAILALFLGYLILAGTPVFIWSWRHKMLWKAITSLPAFIVISYVNLGVYVYALVREVILRKSLTGWHKGH